MNDELGEVNTSTSLFFVSVLAAACLSLASVSQASPT